MSRGICNVLQPPPNKDDPEYQSSEEEEEISPTDFEGDGGDQAISYILALIKRNREKNARGKGKAPSSEHPSNGGPHTTQTKKRKRESDDPTFIPPAPVTVPQVNVEQPSTPTPKRGRGGEGPWQRAGGKKCFGGCGLGGGGGGVGGGWGAQVRASEDIYCTQSRGGCLCRRQPLLRR